jgi:hypothetical protein
MILPSAATEPVEIFWKSPMVYVRSFAADTGNYFLIKELRGFLALENYNDFELQLLPDVYERAAAYIQGIRGINLKKATPELIPDADGGIEIEWENQGRRLVLTCRKRADEDFISWREAGGRYEGSQASQQVLNDKLDWLIS